MNHVYPSLNFNTDQLLTHVGQLVFNPENLLTLRAESQQPKAQNQGQGYPSHLCNPDERVTLRKFPFNG